MTIYAYYVGGKYFFCYEQLKISVQYCNQGLLRKPLKPGRHGCFSNRGLVCLIRIATYKTILIIPCLDLYSQFWC